MGVFEELLEELHSSFEDPCKVGSLILEITHQFKARENESSRDFMIFLLFGECGLLSFLNRIYRSNIHKSNILTLFSFLEFVLVRFEKESLPYAENVKTFCLDIAESDAAAKIREHALKLLKKVFEPPFITELDLSNIMEIIIRMRDKIHPPMQAQLFSIVGIILGKMPQVSDNGHDFLNYFLKKMRRGRKPGVYVMAACLDGINGYLVNFAAQPEQISDIYSIVKAFYNVNNANVAARRCIHRGTKPAERSALKLVTRHYRIFAQYIYEDYEFWHENLKLFLDGGKVDRYLAFEGIKAVYKAVARIIRSGGDDSSSDLEKIVSKLLIQQSDFDISSAIGLVELTSAGIVQENLAYQALQLITKCFNAKIDRPTYLPLKLECSLAYLTKSDTNKSDYLIQAQRLSVNLIDNYPKIERKFKQSAAQALEKSFYCVARCGSHELDEYIKEVIYQGLIRSCSHQIYPYARTHKEITGEGLVTYKTILPLWLHVTNLENSDTDLDNSDKKSLIATKVFDEYVSSFLMINNKLDLRFVIENPHISNAEMRTKASRPSDWQIFINNVGLFIDVVEKVDHRKMKKWLMKIMTAAIGSSYRAPMIGEYYKIMTVCLKIADKIQYFNKSVDNEMLIRRFLRDISHSIGKYKGNTQISCFLTLITAPIRFILPFIKDLVPVFKMILQVTPGNFRLLKESVSALEKWFVHAPKEDMEYLLKNLVHYFDIFLKRNIEVEAVTYAGDSRREIPGIAQVRSSPKGVDKKLSRAQSQFLLFLGSLKTDITEQLFETEEEDDEDDEGDECLKTLTYDMPLKEKYVSIRIGFLPQVIELALSSGDRLTRVRACEFFHSIVTLSLEKLHNGDGEFNGLFRKLLPVCFRLACDTDKKIQPVYEVLTAQMAHYFADKDREISEKETFVDSVMKSASDSYNPALRDLAAKMAREFLEWTPRSLNPNDAFHKSVNVKMILDSIYSFSIHPIHDKRIGAALVFNNIHALIQDDPVLLNRNWFLLYYYFIECLNMCTVYDDTNPITTALELVKTSLRSKALTATAEVPPGFKGDTLDVLFTWIFIRCSHVNPIIRNFCMTAIEDFSDNSVKEFTDIYIIDVHVVKEYEYIYKYGDYESCLNYFSSFFDYYNWLLIHDVVDEEDLINCGTEQVLGLFFLKLANKPVILDAASTVESSCILNLLKLMASSIDRTIVMHHPKLLSLVKTCCYSPRKYKFDLYDIVNREKLASTLKLLMPKLLTVLQRDEAGYLLSAQEYSECVQGLVDRLRRREPLWEVGDLVKGLRIFYDVQLWDGGLREHVTGDKILRSVFNSIFDQNQEISVGFPIEAHDKAYLCDLVDFGIEIGVSLRLIMSLLKNNDKITDEETSNTTTKGEYFMNMFKDELFSYFMRNSEEAIDYLIHFFRDSALTTILNTLNYGSRSNISIGYKKKFASDLCQRWQQLKGLCGKSKTLLLSIVRSMCKMIPEILLEEHTIQDWFFNFMAISRCTKEAEIIFDICLYMSPINSDLDEGLTRILDQIFKNLGFFTSESDNPEPKVLTAYNGLRNGFIRTKNISILQGIIRILRKYKMLQEENEIEKIAAYICQATGNDRVSEEHLRRILSFLYEEIFNMGGTSDEVCEFFFLKFLQKSESHFAWTYLLEILNSLLLALRGQNLIHKTAALKIIESCVGRSTPGDLVNLTATQKEAFRNCVNICSNLPMTEESEPLRKYACCCFNTLCAIIAAEATDRSFYDHIFFKNELAFLSLVICQREKWAVEMDFEEMPKKTKVLVGLRRNITSERQLMGGETVKPVEYLQYDTLFNSSLNEDVTRFDYSALVIRPLESLSRAELGENYLELEMDEINNHECMPTFVAVIKHMVENGLAHPEPSYPPFWLITMIKRMKCTESSQNEKIFLLKVMCNVEEYIRPYATFIVPDIINVLLKVFQGRPINYLFMDVITMIFSWKPTWITISSDYENELTELALYIVNKSYAHRKDIIKYNLEAAKLIIETCMDYMHLWSLTRLAYNRLRETEESAEEDKSVMSFLDLQFCSILIANSIPAWTEGNEEEFMRIIVEYLTDVKNGKLAAEVCGMTLRYFQGCDFAHMNRLMELTKEKVHQIQLTRAAYVIPLIYSIYQHFPEFPSGFIDTIRDSAWRLRGQFKAQSLEMMLSHWKTVDCREQGVFGSTIYTFLMDMLSPDDFEVLFISLQIVEVFLEKTEDRLLTDVFEKALSFADYKITRIRQVVYRIAINLLNKWNTFYIDASPEHVRRMCKTILSKGLTDKEPELREMCLNYWYSITDASEPSTEYAKIFCELYTPESEKIFLKSAAKLIFRSASKGPHFKKCIFDEPLDFSGTCSKTITTATSYHSRTPALFSANLSGSLNRRVVIETGVNYQTNSDGPKRRKRFIRDPNEIHKCIPRKKKRTDFEEELELQKASSIFSDIFIRFTRKFKHGDYPLIEITHSDVLRPLEELALHDFEISRLFLASLFDGFARHVTEDMKDMFRMLGELIRQIFQGSSSYDPAVTAFFFHILTHCGPHIKINSELIENAARSTECVFGGALAIENLITYKETASSDDLNANVTEEDNTWIRLGLLNRCVKEFEVLNGIFVDKVRVAENIVTGMRSETVYDWRNAAKYYEDGLKNDGSSMSGFCVNAYANSLAELSDWTKLDHFIRNTCAANDIWKDNLLVDNALPWYMKSVFGKSESAEGLLEEISGIQRDPEKRKHLKTLFVDELAVSHVLNGNYDCADYYAHQKCFKLLSKWSRWNKWPKQLRLSKFTEIKLMSEVHQCLGALKEKTSEEVSRVAEMWSKNGPEETDYLLPWDIKLTFRNHFLSKLKNSCPDLDLTQIRKSFVDSELDIVRFGIAQKNVEISEKYLKNIEKDLDICDDVRRFMHGYFTIILDILKAHVLEVNNYFRVKKFVRCIFRLDEQMYKTEDVPGLGKAIFYDYNMELNKISHSLVQLDESLVKLAAFGMSFSKDTAKASIKLRELEYLERACSSIEGINEKLLADTYVRILKYYLREGYSRYVAEYLFLAMSLGNVEARQFFSLLLSEVAFADDWMLNEEIRNAFRRIPIWMFLSWTDHLLANLDSEMFPFIKEVLSGLATEYPESIRSALEISKSNYVYNHKYGDECRMFVNALSEKLWSTNYRNLLTGLSFVVQPDLVMKYDLRKLSAEINSLNTNWDKVSEMVQDLYKKLYGLELEQFRGSAYNRINRVKPIVEDMLFLQREKPLWKDKLGVITHVVPNCQTYDTLKSYSPWLYNFHGMTQNIRFELPGQYSGDHKPLTQYHVYISSFKHKVLVMDSKRKPIRISILGDNGREYKFLVKFGEDPRHEQRIQQVFGQMNYVLRRNKATSQYFIDTYNVIPLERNLGLTKWVNNTVSLFGMLERSDPSIKESAEEVQTNHLQFLIEDENVSNMKAVYSNAYKRIDRDRALGKFIEGVDHFKPGILKDAFWNLCTFPDEFFYMRKNFASSEAVIFIAHWLLGIGDRNLDNTRISYKTGRALGTSFGCSFGFSTEFLTPPELVPFRLTPQIMNLLKPMGTSGVIKETMIYCLKALREEKLMLLATLNIFTSQSALERIEKALSDIPTAKPADWSLQRKIAMVKEKLEGANPIKIFSDDLRSGHSSSDCLEQYLQVLCGSRTCEPELTVENQVEILIQLATDYHILSKTYAGWNPWL